MVAGPAAASLLQQPHPSHDALDTSMFWVGALFAFTPIVLGGAVLFIWWRRRRQERDDS